ncbi:peripheral plasma membrane protein CASK-like X2 [Biomphalaria glabrata]|nr:Biomphalaria glabrata peripheral plasma membrane protein CASK-like; transcript variant X2 [Biomphalaria glabrata]
MEDKILASVAHVTGVAANSRHYALTDSNLGLQAFIQMSLYNADISSWPVLHQLNYKNVFFHSVIKHVKVAATLIILHGCSYTYHTAWLQLHLSYCMAAAALIILHGCSCTYHTAWLQLHLSYCMAAAALIILHGCSCTSHTAWLQLHFSYCIAAAALIILHGCS